MQVAVILSVTMRTSLTVPYWLKNSSSSFSVACNNRFALQLQIRNFKLIKAIQKTKYSIDILNKNSQNTRKILTIKKNRPELQWNVCQSLILMGLLVIILKTTTHLNWNPTKKKFVRSIAVGLSWYNQVITGWRNTILGDRSILKNVIFPIELVPNEILKSGFELRELIANGFWVNDSEKLFDFLIYKIS